MLCPLSPRFLAMSLPMLMYTCLIGCASSYVQRQSWHFGGLVQTEVFGPIGFCLVCQIIVGDPLRSLNAGYGFQRYHYLVIGLFDQQFKIILYDHGLV